MRVAVTGAGGGLGRAFLAAAGDEHDVHPFTRAELDIRSFAAVKGAFGSLEADVVMHFAAMTAVDACEEDPQRAVDTNVGGSFNVATAAREADALLVAISTDYVFDGEKDQPYDERDRPNPISMYGRTKYAGELAAKAAGPDLVIVRTAWVFGAGEDYASRAIRRLRDGESVGAIVDQVGSPTHVGHLAEALVALLDTGVRGIVHLAGTEAVTWHEVLVRAKRLGELSGTVVAQKADELDRPALRPANSALRSVILGNGETRPAIPPLDEGIRRVLTHVGV